MALALLLH